MIILPLLALTFSHIHAEDTRDQVRNEILKSFGEADQARQTTIDALQKTVKSIEDARAHRDGEEQTQKSTETKIVESREIANISQSTATVEIAKIHAKGKIIKAIVRVEALESGKATPEKIETEKAIATKKIVKAIATVEIVKAKAARTIIEATKQVEISKTKEKYNILDDASALKIAKNISAVKIARSVSAVEITEAVSNVKITKALLNEDVVLFLKEQYEDLTLDEIKSKAKADISTITARMEVARARSLADIAQIVSFVKITEAIKLQNEDEENIEADDKRSAYPKEFIRFNVK